MKTSTLANVYTAATVAALLSAMAWGNAVAMFVVSVNGLLVGLVIFGRNFARVGTLVAVAGCAMAVAAFVALALHRQ